MRREAAGPSDVKWPASIELELRWVGGVWDDKRGSVDAPRRAVCARLCGDGPAATAAAVVAVCWMTGTEAGTPVSTRAGPRVAAGGWTVANIAKAPPPHTAARTALIVVIRKGQLHAAWP